MMVLLELEYIYMYVPNFCHTHAQVFKHSIVYVSQAYVYIII